jgi:ammonia channel protein AmtB
VQGVWGLCDGLLSGARVGLASTTGRCGDVSLRISRIIGMVGGTSRLLRLGRRC